MDKQEIRKHLSIFFLQGLTDLMKEDPKIEVINVQVCLFENPNYDKVGAFRINVIKRRNKL